MGIFSKPIVTCEVCRREIGAKEKRWKTKEGYLCPDCQKPFGIWSGPRAFIGYTADEIRDLSQRNIAATEFLAKNKDLFDLLVISRNIENILFIDDTNKKWYFTFGDPYKNAIVLDENIRYPVVFNFNDITAVDISLGDKVITSAATTRKDKGLRKAAAGALIGGAPGAIIGSMMASSKTTFQTIESQQYYINVTLVGESNTIRIPASNEQLANSLYSAFLSIIPQNEHVAEKTNNNKESNNIHSPADEIRKFKELLDDGLITQDEFDAKKKQLLDL